MRIGAWRTLLAGFAAAGATLILFVACTPPGTTPFPPVPAEWINKANKYEKTDAIMAEGETAYLTHCATCHGYAADGFGPQYQLYSPRPTSFKTDVFQAKSDGEIFYNAWNGNQDTEEMAGLNHRGKKVTEDEVWKVVHFLRTAPSR
ncbi:MAG: hypothetical protein CL790_02130 [Chloroflexi bacterium]|nr:hypothetical protein [Chloroflexota bacterium]HCU73030.1 hypothetical protein [Chloroflexota bacterium]|tara:strand:- start:8226 stop:8666 length:441 start_codon:yes stop_codon:yes gene_type:complete